MMTFISWNNISKRIVQCFVQFCFHDIKILAFQNTADSEFPYFIFYRKFWNFLLQYITKTKFLLNPFLFYLSNSRRFQFQSVRSRSRTKRDKNWKIKKWTVSSVIKCYHQMFISRSDNQSPDNRWCTVVTIQHKMYLMN